MSIYDTLNKEQRDACFHTEGPVLILAGAGSGKTRVITHRISYLMEECGVNPWNILAITFTNKAAGEMRERVDKLIGFGAESIWISTFHSMCVRILRRHIDQIGYDSNFTIYDTDDQKTLIRQICRRMNIDSYGSVPSWRQFHRRKMICRMHIVFRKRIPPVSRKRGSERYMWSMKRSLSPITHWILTIF